MARKTQLATWLQVEDAIPMEQIVGSFAGVRDDCRDRGSVERRELHVEWCMVSSRGPYTRDCEHLQNRASSEHDEYLESGIVCSLANV